MSATNNIRISEIAEKLGLSVSTVSIVLNGRGDDLRISKSTQKRILDYCREFNYQPNIYARRLRAAGREESAPIIALFIPVSTNGVMISRFLAGIQRIPEISSRKVEIILQPFESNQLVKCRDMLTRNRYSGVIIVGMATKDEAFIYNTDFSIPIVLLNRSCKRHSAVCVDNRNVGFTAARLFEKTGHRHVAVVLPNEPTEPLSKRYTAFVRRCRELNLSLPDSCIIKEDMNYGGGKHAVEKLLRQCGDTLPTAVLFLESSMAIGSLVTFREAGLRVPDDIQILSYGDNSQEPFTVPSLSCIRMPIEEMSVDCIRILLRFFSTNQWDHTIIRHPTPIILRDSFRCSPETLEELQSK